MEGGGWERRLRVEVEVGKEIPSDGTLRTWEEAVRATPGAVRPQPYDRIWVSTVRVSDPGTDEGTDRVSSGRSASLGEALQSVRNQISWLFAERLAVETVPVDQRFAEVLGTPREPEAADLARRLAAALGLEEPEQAQSIQLLVKLALAGHIYYDDPTRGLDHAEAGYTLAGLALSRLSSEDLTIALEDLGLTGRGDPVDTVAGLAVALLERMGFEVR